MRLHSPTTPHRLARLLLASALGAAGVLSLSTAAQAQTQPGATRTVVTQADQLPRRTVKLDRLPSEYLSAPFAEVQALGAALERSLREDLERFDIRDQSTLRGYNSALLSLVLARGDWAAVGPAAAQLRGLEEKVSAKLTAGVLNEIFARARMNNFDATWVQAEVASRYGAMPWATVQDAVKALKGSMETFNPELIKGAFQSQLDALAKNGNMTVPESAAMAIVQSRIAIENLSTMRVAVLTGLQSVVDLQSKATAKPDIWTPRTFAVAEGAKASVVKIAIWDSGVDLTLFKAAAERGSAFDADGVASPHLLRPLGEAAPRWPQMRETIHGSQDVQAALDTPEARAFRARLAALKADEVRSFMTDTALASMYVHGTHVAGIAVEGNPFAQVYAATMLWSHLPEPKLPTEARARASASAYAQTVDNFKKAGVRVVNMSWRYGPSAYEAAFAFHNKGGTVEERKAEARRLFAIEREALRAAIAGAPEILFVAGSGNEDNSADFAEYIPAGFVLPNLITVGAVDRAGAETSFSTFGKTVVVHANGFQVEAPIPGGVRMKLSGTSMASPQVANLAGKLLALKPELTVAQVKAAILDGAERQVGADGKPGRVNLANPRKSAALLGLVI